MTKKTTDSASSTAKQAIDPVVLSHALTEAMERTMPLLKEYMERRGREGGGLQAIDPMLEMQDRFAAFMGVLMSNPKRLAELQMDYWKNWSEIWQNSMQKMGGVAADDIYKPAPTDRRFKSAEWNENVLFDFIKQSYLMTSNWMRKVVHSTEGLDKNVVDQLDFYTRQFADAMAPTNFILTNPDVLRETIRTGGENLVKGLENMIEDMERGHGDLKISTTDFSAFEPGKNLAITKGAVVYQNDLIQLIQYEATSDSVYKTPLLIVPPWINKYYILDMRQENSFIKWLVDQGHTVFVVSWANPDASLKDKGFDDYMHEGILAAIENICQITEEKSVNAIGYCIGGTLLTITLAWMKAKGIDNKINSATFLTTLIDFEQAGELKFFTDEKQIDALEKTMVEHGVLSGDYLQNTFSMLRANDMIWSFVINNYLLGKEPFPFDLLYWNSDTTNMPCAMLSFYLRKMYLENKLIEPEGLTIEGVSIDIRDIKTPAYFLSTREDHIAPWKATYSGYSAFTGDKTFTLSASGHVAGVVNPPTANKYCYWTSQEDTPSPEKWLEHATEARGSWWVNWQEWIAPHAGNKVNARDIKEALEPAPGSFVKKKLT